MPLPAVVAAAAKKFADKVADTVEALGDSEGHFLEIKTNLKIDTSDSSAVSSAYYDVLRGSLVVQYRYRTPKLYFFPMAPPTAVRFAYSESKGRFLAAL